MRLVRYSGYCYLPGLPVRLKRSLRGAMNSKASKADSRNQRNKSMPSILKVTFVSSSLLLGAINPVFAFDGGDAAKGEGVFKKCMSCHMVGDDAKNRVGPLLNAVFGRAAGTADAYKYGKSIVEAGANGLIWNEEEMFAYLADPKKYLRTRLDNKKAKSKMSFKLKDEQDRKDVIAYIKTFSPDYQPAGSDGESEESSSEETTTTN